MTLRTSTPLYRRIVADLTAKIQSGELVSDDQIPSTKDLQLAYGCSLTAINQATLVLTAAGLIYGVPGVGRYVK